MYQSTCAIAITRWDRHGRRHRPRSEPMGSSFEPAPDSGLAFAQRAELCQYCPIFRASEILGDRWTLLIVREMLAEVCGFNELQRGLQDLALGPHRSAPSAGAGRDHRASDGPKGRTLGVAHPRRRDLESVVQALGEWGDMVVH